MGRMYTAPFSNITVSVAQDCFEVLAAAGKPLAIHQVIITVSEDETNQQLRFHLARAAGSYTSGSGGGTITPVALSSSMPAAGATVERNNTTVAAVGSGTYVTLWSEGIPSQGGFSFLPTPDMRPIIHPTEAFIVSLGNNPDAAVSMCGVVVFEEL